MKSSVDVSTAVLEEFGVPRSTLDEARELFGAILVDVACLLMARHWNLAPRLGYARGSELADTNFSELDVVILFLLAGASPDSRFSTNPDAEIFIPPGHGFSSVEDRIYVTGLSRILAVAGAKLRELEPLGGRMIVRRCEIVRATDERLLTVFEGW